MSLFMTGPFTEEIKSGIKKGALVQVIVDDRPQEWGIVKSYDKRSGSIIVSGFHKNPVYIQPEFTAQDLQKAPFIGGVKVLLETRYPLGSRFVAFPADYPLPRGVKREGIVISTGHSTTLAVAFVSDVLHFHVRDEEHGTTWQLADTD